MRDTSPPETVALVLHFRDHERTSRCLASLEREGVECVVIVDNSGDGGASLQRLFGEKPGCRHPNPVIEVVDPGVNLGFSAGVNRGLERIRELRGESCVLLLNSDAELRPGAHEALRRGIQAGLEMAAASMLSPDGSRLDSAYYQPFAGIISSRAWPGSFRYFSACCMLLGPALSSRPLLDERFFFYGEDIELGWRLIDSHIAHGVVEGASVDHEGSAASGNGSLFYEYHLALAHMLLPSRLARNSASWAGMLLGRLVVLPLRATLRSLRSSSLTPWTGLLLAIGHLLRGTSPSIQPGGR